MESRILTRDSGRGVVGFISRRWMVRLAPLEAGLLIIRKTPPGPTTVRDIRSSERFPPDLSRALLSQNPARALAQNLKFCLLRGPFVGEAIWRIADRSCRYRIYRKP